MPLFRLTLTKYITANDEDAAIDQFLTGVYYSSDIDVEEIGVD